MRYFLPLVCLLFAGCSTPSFAIINFVMPGGRVQVGQMNESRSPKGEAASAVPALKSSEIGDAGHTVNPEWKPLVP